jgi:hypothetical protein
MSGVVAWIPKTALRIVGPLLLLAFLPSIEGCEDSTGPETTQVKVLLTDAAADYIESAVVTISRVYLQGCAEGEEGEDAECEPVELYPSDEWTEDPLQFDLMTLRGGIYEDLTGLVTVPEASYRQLRLVVDEAVVTLFYDPEDELVEDFTFENPTDAESPNVAFLKVPSGMESGIKVHLNGPIGGDGSDLTTVLVDFDVNANFVLQGPDENNVFRGIIFTPTLKEKGRSHEGEVS